jgi:RTX calcium-binding nonapeptide repeat (4 copies)
MSKLVRTIPVAVLVSAALLVAPPAASAATTLGQTSPTIGVSCGGGANSAYAQRSTGGPPSYQAPTAGVITSWSHEAQPGAGQSARLKVYRPTANPLQFVVVGNSVSEAITPSSLNIFPTRVPIEAGNVLGIAQTSVAAIRCVFETTNPGDVDVEGTGNDDPPGATTTFPSFFPTTRLNVTATLEPDCDNDGLGDETQDTNLSTCPATGPAAGGHTCKGKPATIVGTNGSDVRAGSQGRDVIAGLGGNDTLSGLAGNDVICGGAGKDTLKGGPGNDFLSGQKGNDKLFGQKGKDKLSGKKGKDLCVGGPGKETAKGCEVEKSI